MQEPPELRSVLDSAEQAAAAGDYASAERLLRQAALLQEASLGSLHPDLANTLNNLGVVYQITGRPADAEDCYRRAYAIATAILVPDHPFVATSGQNLREFCEARGTPVEVPAALPTSAAEPERPRAAPLAPSEAFVDIPLEHTPREQSHPPKRKSRPLVIATICAGALVMIALVATRLWFASKADAGFSPDSAAQTRPVSPPPTPEPVREPVPAAPILEPKDTAAGSPAPAAARDSPATAGSALALPSVAEARVCKNLSTRSRDWQCDPAGSPVEPGTLFFFTRLKAANDTTVEHRWYQGERLHQAVELRVRANPVDGYRTYSRNTVNSPNAGDWKVELRAKDGTLLGEERFTVR